MSADTALLRAAAWPAAHAAEALAALAEAAGLPLQAGATPDIADAPSPVDADADDTDTRARRLAWAAAQAGLDAEPVDAPVPGLAAMLAQAGPALVPWGDADGPAWLLLLRGGSARGLRLLAPDGQVRRVPLATLRDALAAPHEAPLAREVDALLDAAEVPPRRRAAARRGLLDDRLGATRTAPLWLLRLPAGAPWWTQCRQAGLPQRLAGLVAVFAALYAAEVAGWSMIGDGVLNGRLDTGWLVAWWMLLFTVLPLQALASGLNAALATGTAGLLKARLMAGALRIAPSQIRQLGSGQLLGRVIESQALESLVVQGSLAAVVGAMELGVAGWVLAQGAAPGPHLAALAGWTAVTAALATGHLRRLRQWTGHRLDLTHALVEQMMGHRTRLAQEQPARRDAREDAALRDYLDTCTAMDRRAVPLAAGAPAGWMLLSLAALAPALAAGGATPVALAISLGGILMAQRALGGLAAALVGGGRAAVAWRAVAPLFQAGRDGAPDPRPVDPRRTARGPLLDAQGLTFAHPGGPPVLQGVDLRIERGDRLLLQGPSGGGKSTLAGLLTGQHAPQAGLLLLQGLDAPTLGSQWTALAASAPQFHDNHVMAESLAFNLLMGRRWPATEADLAEAQALCEDLGLGDLLARMPGGLMQRVGEGGWQLSHGERSRVFLARALLQGAPLTVLDESFAALDPATLARCLRCAMDRADTLMVIAHP